MQPGRADDPLLRQVLPLMAERLPLPGFSCDPLAEAQAMRLPGLLHKFHGRVLLIVSGHCPIHCRYCFRRHFPYAATQPARGDWQRVFDCIAGDPSISEVILSGGDPLSLPDRQLQWLIDGLAAIPQLRRLRLHSRLPVLIPARITPRLVRLLADCRLPVSLVIHANHAQELDEAVAAALAPLRRAGVTLLNQSVLLAGVNDRLDDLCALSERLFAIGVLPYYLHLLDRVAGAGHFAVADERVHELHAGLLARLPGYLVPRLVREVAQAPSKVPLPLVGRRLSRCRRRCAGVAAAAAQRGRGWRRRCREHALQALAQPAPVAALPVDSLRSRWQRWKACWRSRTRSGRSVARPAAWRPAAAARCRPCNGRRAARGRRDRDGRRSRATARRAAAHGHGSRARWRAFSAGRGRASARPAPRSRRGCSISRSPSRLP
jgi:EF-P beta-lysylation protein EpmB